MSLQNGPFWLVKRPFLSAEKGHFAMSFGMFCKLIELQLLTKPLLIMSTFELSLRSCYTIIYIGMQTFSPFGQAWRGCFL